MVEVALFASVAAALLGSMGEEADTEAVAVVLAALFEAALGSDSEALLAIAGGGLDFLALLTEGAPCDGDAALRPLAEVELSFKFVFFVAGGVVLVAVRRTIILNSRVNSYLGILFTKLRK